MINVLPQNEKILLRKEYIKRLITLSLFIFSVLGFLASFLLMPSYVLSNNKVSTLEIQLKRYNESNTDKTEGSLTKIITEINQDLAILNKDASKPVSFTEDVLAVVLSSKPKNIKLANLSYFVNEFGKKNLEINGQAPDRATLRLFEDTLKANSRVESTNLPASNFTKRTNIDFVLTVVIK